MIVYADYTKLNSNSRQTVMKNSDLVTSDVEKAIQEIWDDFEYSPISVQTESLFAQYIQQNFVPHTILGNEFNIFFVSQQQINVFIFF